MAVNCDKYTYRHDGNQGDSGPSLVGKHFYTSGSGGPVMDGYYSDGVYIYQITGGYGVVQSAFTPGSQTYQCGGATPDPTQPPAPQGTLYNFAVSTSSAYNACNNAL